MIVAKMLCSSATRPYEGVEYVILHAVYSSDPTSPNYSFSKATPSAEIRMTITNPGAIGEIEEGVSYLVRFERA